MLHAAHANGCARQGEGVECHCVNPVRKHGALLSAPPRLPTVRKCLLRQLSWDAIKGGCPELPKVVALNEIGLKRLQRDQGFTALRSGADL
jgi:hypothetical protein